MPSSVASTSTTAVAGGPAAAVYHGPRTASQVALTFHGSGDPALTTRLLDEVHAAGAPITVFAVGQWLEQHPTIARTVLTGGHELANHTYTHPSLGRLGAPAVASEVRRCRDVLTAQTGSGGRWFRPSGMDRSTPLVLQEAGAAGYATVVGYDVDSLDYTDPGADAVVRKVRTEVQPGSIVSLHLGHEGTVEALPTLLGDLRSRNLRPVTVSTLLA